MSDNSDPESHTKRNEAGEHLEVIRTISRVPDNPNYYEKNGLRTEGDGMDHEQYNPKSIGFIMTVLGCSFGLCASQITPLLYLTLGTTIAADLERPDLLLWLLTAGIVAQGALAPFVGPLADLFGRRLIFLVGFIMAIVGCVMCGAGLDASAFLAGQILLGFGAVTQELMAIAVVAEIVPTAKRPIYAAITLCCIIPWTPGTMYANWISISSWRWVGLVLALWNAISFCMIAAFYHPPPRVNGRGLTTKQKWARIDFIGGILLTTGLVFVLVALNWGGQAYSWTSVHVLAFLIVGFVILIVFGLWERFGAPHPMFPRRIVHAPRPFFCMLFVIFAAGINYIPLVVFWPIQAISVYQADHYTLGIYTLPIGTCILAGAIVSALLLGLLKGRTTAVMTFFCVMQTVGSACLTVADPHDHGTIIAPLVLALIGVGGVLVPNQVIITVITPDDLIASVTALTVGLRAQAQVVGLAIYYNRFLAEITKNTYTYIVPAFVQVQYGNPELIEHMVEALTSVPFREWATTVPPFPHADSAAILQEAATQAFAHAFKLVYYITIAFGVPACIAAALMGDVSKYLDKHVAVVL
ncbi:hypothetical protein LTR24_008884 [Lithohypha guttulata]|uniref:Major facilitator superfamily (MFS) profile domain-containing protein n=1 Tax=Lithohypha guttulata TaxID=1690604 RepID=A0ABR0JYZ6_9EURO|nr:hypothetical protein LTR24_008884 [Lithohypha guttulata]